MLEHAVLLLWLAEGPTAAASASLSCSASTTKTAVSVTPVSEWITELSAVASIPSDALRGRHLSAHGARVTDVARDGFWVVDEGTHCRIFVVPAEGALIDVAVGELVDLQGEFRAWTQPRKEPRVPAFLYAYTVREAP